MSIYGGKELAEAFRTVRKNTIQVAEDIPEDKYKHVAGEGCRSVARMLTHVAISTRIWEEIHKQGLTTLQGFDFFGMIDKFTAEEIKPCTKAEIVALYHGFSPILLRLSTRTPVKPARSRRCR